MLDKLLGKLQGCYKSAVIWFNALTLSLMSLFELFHDSLSELSQYLPTDLYKKVGLVVILVNLALRFKTSKSLQDK